MNPFAFSGLLVLISTLFFGFFVFFNNPKSRVNRIWLVFSISVALWGLAALKIGLIPETEKETALLWWKITYLGIIFIPVVFYHFVHAWLGIKNKIFLFIFYLWGIFFFVLQWTPWADLFFGLNTITFVFSTAYIVRPATPLFTFFVLCWAGIIFYSHYELYRFFKKSVGLKKNQIKYFFLGIAIAFIGGGATFLIPFGVNLYPFLNFAIPLYPAIMAYAILRYRLMDIRIVFSRAGIFLAVYTVVLGIPFIVLKHTGSGWLATSLAVIFASLGPLIYRFLQMKAESVILAQQHRYQKILLQTAIGMVTQHNLKKLSKLIAYILKNTIRINFSAIYIRNKKDNFYRLESIRGGSSIGECAKNFSAQDPFIGYLKKNIEYFFFEDAPEQIKGSSNILSKSKVVIPALIGDELLGFVFLGEKINGQPYTNEDIDVFKILSRQAALAIENCIFFEESKDSQERMFAAEKLASIGGMAEGVAHQIKNRLNLFSLAGGELKIEIKDFIAKHDQLIKINPDLDKTFKYLNEIANSVLDNVKRTDGIIKGILDFAKTENKGNLFSVFSFKGVVELATQLLMLKHEAASLPISVKIDTEDAIYGVKSQLTEVIYNLLDNAYEAIKERAKQVSLKNLEPFSPLIEFSLTYAEGRQIIKISDNGIGIKEEDKPKIFAPFFTTKTSYKSGSGIGAYVVKRIIEENHKGKIWFTSTYMQGSSFIIELPKIQH
ncbi:MAG: ATP-binding protein [Candidatus Omnitrophica bacterium]|nr:ATP-binding protein [Candidatus Omnitrophota bacterium]